jgi:hypothetical protein
MLHQTRGCGGRDVAPTRGDSVRRGGRPSTRTTPDQSCLWCAEKGHTIFDCPSPPTPALKKVCAKGLNDDHKARRLATADTSVIVSDDEIDEGDDLAHNTYADIQALFVTNEPTKPF